MIFDNCEEIELREKVIKVLEEQGFKVDSHIRPIEDSKAVYRQIHQKSKLEKLALNKQFLLKYFEKVKSFCRNGYEIVPEGISLELREVKAGSLEEVLFKWWNLVWWSIPFERAYGRQMRFLLWDKTHNMPFGLITLQSPVLKMSVRDRYLNLSKEELDIWVNMSMNAQRVGALPPYNDLLGGKMVALALTCNEIREAYKQKYDGRITIINKRVIKPELLFITTTSAFGKSSVYNRLRYNGELVAISLGYTKGSGTFHIPEKIYEEILNFLAKRGIDVSRGLGHGSSRKLKLLSLGLKLLGLPRLAYHGIKREFYLFPLVKNLEGVIHNREEPIWINRPFTSLVDYWKERYAIPRSQRLQKWKEFDKEKFFEEVKEILRNLT